MILRFAELVLLAFGFTSAQVVPRHARIDCLPSPGASKEKCISYGCFWDDYYDETDPTVPLCYYPMDQGGYEATTMGKIVTLTKRNDGPKNPYSTDISKLYMSTAKLGATLNIKIGPTDRYEIPIRIPRKRSFSTDSIYYEQSQSSPYYFKIIRKSNQQVLWDTSIGFHLFHLLDD